MCWQCCPCKDAGSGPSWMVAPAGGPLPARAGSRQRTNSRQHSGYPAIKAPPAGAWSALCWYSSLAVKDKALYYRRWRVASCALHSLAAQRRRPQSQQTDIPAPGKTARTKRQRQPCKSHQKCLLKTTTNLWIYGTGKIIYKLLEDNGGQLALSVDSPKDARGQCRCFHRRMPGGNKEH